MNESKKLSLTRYMFRAFLYFHVTIFIGINTLLIVTNYLITPNTPWFIIPLSFWGLILLCHFIAHFFLESNSAKKWRDSHAKNIEPIAAELGLTQEELRKRASSRLFFRMVFYFHLSIYLGSSFMMVIINYLVNPQDKWSLIVISSWGLWLLIHSLLTYLCFSASLESWRIAKIRSFSFSENPAKSKRLSKEGIILFGFWLAFRVHLLLFTLTNLLLFILDMTLNKTNVHWFFYPLIGWGIILLSHGLLTFLITSPQLALWRKDKLSQNF